MPRNDAIQAYLNSLGLKGVSNFSPRFESQTFEMLSVRWQILDSLKSEKLERAKELLELLKKSDSFLGAVNQQFVRSSRVRLALLENRADEELLQFITESAR